MTFFIKNFSKAPWRIGKTVILALIPFGMASTVLAEPSSICDGPFYRDGGNAARMEDGITQTDFVELFNYPSQNPFVDTLRYVLCEPKNYDQSFIGRQYPIYSDFFLRGNVHSVNVLPGKPALNYKAWLRDEPAPLIVILPGLGSHYNDSVATALAELYFLRGCSSIVLSNALNWEFIRSASTSLAPGYTPIDARDIHRALRCVIKDLRNNRGLRSTETVLLGYSLGALHSLFVTRIDDQDGGVGVDRVIAINPPVNVMRALTQIDELYSIWTTWPDPKVPLMVDKATTGFFLLYKQVIGPEKPVPLNADEAKFLIGFSFHLTLRELIYSVHQRSRLGVVTAPDNWFSRDDFYDQTSNMTFRDYVDLFIVPYCQGALDKALTIETLNHNGGLRALETFLAVDDRIRVFHNADDFLLNDKDRAWLRKTLGERVVFFNHGGHLGNLGQKDVQAHLVKALWFPCEACNFSSLPK